MPRKLIRRWLPDTSKIAANKRTACLGTLLADPNLFHLNRHSVSSAFFIGLFCAFLPIPGQVVVGSLMALWWRSNLPISILLIWISNPITIPPMMILLYKFGQLILGNEARSIAFEFTWTWFAEQGPHVYLPIAIGGVIAGLIFGTLGYISIQLLWRWKVVNNWQARKEKRLHQDS